MHPDIQTPESGGRLLVVLSTCSCSNWAWLFGEASTPKGQAQVSDDEEYFVTVVTAKYEVSGVPRKPEGSRDAHSHVISQRKSV